MKGGIDLVLLRPREDLYYLSQPWIDFTHLPDGQREPRPLPGAEPRAGCPSAGRVQRQGDWRAGQRLPAGQDAGDAQLHRRSRACDSTATAWRFSESHVSPRVNAAYRLPSGTVLFGSYNHFYVPPPIENVLASSAGLTSLVSEIGTTVAAGACDQGEPVRGSG